MRLIGPNLRRVYAAPDDAAAREAMMLGATLAGLAFSNASVALIHGMSRPIGAHFHVPHGLSNAMLLPAVTEYGPAAALPRYAEAARCIGCASPPMRTNWRAANFWRSCAPSTTSWKCRRPRPGASARGNGPTRCGSWRPRRWPQKPGQQPAHPR
jgi:hypothetical protein